MLLNIYSNLTRFDHIHLKRVQYWVHSKLFLEVSDGCVWRELVPEPSFAFAPDQRHEVLGLAVHGVGLVDQGIVERALPPPPLPLQPPSGVYFVLDLSRTCCRSCIAVGLWLTQTHFSPDMKAMFDESFKKSVKFSINEDFLRQPS